MQIGQGRQCRARERAFECRPREPALSEIGLCIVENRVHCWKSGALSEIWLALSEIACAVGNRVLHHRKSGLRCKVQSPHSAYAGSILQAAQPPSGSASFQGLATVLTAKMKRYAMRMRPPKKNAL